MKLKCFAVRTIIGLLLFQAAAAGSAAPSDPAQIEVYPLAAGDESGRGRKALPPADQAAPMDPVMRALMIGVLASILREAAAQPDPMEALGDAVERRLRSAVADPRTLSLMESVMAEAFQQAPEALREPLTQFARSVLRDLRRDLLARPNRSY